jgi:hypothetical protein
MNLNPVPSTSGALRLALDVPLSEALMMTNSILLALAGLGKQGISEHEETGALTELAFKVHRAVKQAIEICRRASFVTNPLGAGGSDDADQLREQRARIVAAIAARGKCQWRTDMTDKANAATHSVSEPALIKRINRKLRQDDEVMKIARGTRTELELGRYYILNFNRNFVAASIAIPKQSDAS